MYPIGAIDLFYYIGELKLTYVYHQNPYLVTFLPTFAADPLAKLAAFLEWPLVYGPAWVTIAGWPMVVAGFDDVLRALVVYKLWSLLFLALAARAIALYHDDARSRWLSVYLFLANPLILFEAVGNAHNDVMMTMFLLAAVAATKRGSWLALPLLLIAALIKAFALVLAPIFLIAIYRQHWARRSQLLSVALSVAVVCVVLLPFWANGAMISGMLRAVTAQQSIPTTSIISLVQEYL